MNTYTKQNDHTVITDQRVDFVGCHHIESEDGLSVCANMESTIALLNEKIEVLQAKGFEVVSVSTVISGTSTYGQFPVAHQQPQRQGFISHFIDACTETRRQKKLKKSNNPQHGKNMGASHLLQAQSSLGIPYSMGFSYTQGFTIFSKKTVRNLSGE
ncbi:hypothetical protein [Cysteiniphilum litorale]|uniref:hypothetical protein n=1 Tax=Cysteiniphilum litorale TaxID=2056700 RepID=UPI003F8812C2